jgi:hypothetical protein
LTRRQKKEAVIIPTGRQLLAVIRDMVLGYSEAALITARYLLLFAVRFRLILPEAGLL